MSSQGRGWMATLLSTWEWHENLSSGHISCLYDVVIKILHGCGLGLLLCGRWILLMTHKWRCKLSQIFIWRMRQSMNYRSKVLIKQRKNIFIIIPGACGGRRMTKPRPRGEGEVTGECSQRHQADQAPPHSSGIPSSSFPVLSHILQGPALLSVAINATIASTGIGHRGVTTGTAAVSLTGCDTLLSTINDYKAMADMTWQPNVTSKTWRLAD